MKSSITIAPVIVMEPDILTRDELAANLDLRLRRSLIMFLMTLKHSKMITSHDLDLILDVCERCIVIGDGRTRTVRRRSSSRTYRYSRKTARSFRCHSNDRLD
jgi:energy-coupling factor transporter ATP-binding protein EcfA2